MAIEAKNPINFVKGDVVSLYLSSEASNKSALTQGDSDGTRLVSVTVVSRDKPQPKSLYVNVITKEFGLLRFFAHKEYNTKKAS